MKTYQFKTTATMKPYNNKKWWISPDIIPTIIIAADDIKTALVQYQTICEEKHYVRISNNALKQKNPMYVDTKSGETKQVGYVITAITDFEYNRCKWVAQYIDLWVSIDEIHNAFEEEN